MDLVVYALAVYGNVIHLSSSLDEAVPVPVQALGTDYSSYSDRAMIRLGSFFVQAWRSAVEAGVWRD